MKTLKDFIEQRNTTQAGQAEMSKSKELIADSLSSVKLPELGTASVGLAAGFLLSKRNKDSEFADSLVETANSEAFLSEFSQTIGEPKPDETEDEFVLRAKSTFKKLLNQKLSS
ncbi:hypothetical protein D3C76_1333040 [compost metagenome]